MATLESELVKTMLYLERYHGDSLGIIEDNLKTAQTNILNGIADTTDQRKIKKIVKDEMTGAFEGIDEEVMQDVEHITGTTWDSMGEVMAKGFATATAVDAFKDFKSTDKLTKERLTNPNRLIQGHTIADHFKHISATNARKIQGQILDGNTKGLGTQEIARNIRNTIGNVNRNQVNTIVRTALLEATEDAKNEAFEFFDDEIIGWRYSAVMDTRTSKVCFINNGIRHKKKTDFKVKPKNHYNCRSMLVPITEFSEELDKDAEKRVVQWDGKTVNHRDGTKSTKYKVGEMKAVPKNANAETYFKAFDKEYQIKYMGVKRYELWKSGKMSFNDAFNASRKKGLSIDKVKTAVSKPKVPEIKFGYDKKYDDFVSDIRPEAKTIIDRLPKAQIKSHLDSDGVGRPFYSYQDGGSHKDSVVFTADKRDVFLHEYGHHIDGMIGNSKKGFVSLNSKDDNRFTDAIRRDMRKFDSSDANLQRIKDIMYYSDSNGKIKVHDRMDLLISDNIDAMVEGRFRDDFKVAGHGKAFKDGMDWITPTEIFANNFALWADKRKWSEYSKLMPNTALQFEDMMKEVIDGKSKQVFTSKVSGSVNEILSDWVDTGYGRIRESYYSKTSSKSKDVLNAMFDNYDGDYSGEAYRGLSFYKNSPDRVKMFEKFQDIEVGESFSDVAPMSFSKDIGVANSFANLRESGDFSVVISMKKYKTNGYDISDISWSDWEKEVMFKPEIEYRVIKKETDSLGNIFLDIEEK